MGRPAEARRDRDCPVHAAPGNQPLRHTRRSGAAERQNLLCCNRVRHHRSERLSPGAPHGNEGRLPTSDWVPATRNRGQGEFRSSRVACATVHACRRDRIRCGADERRLGRIGGRCLAAAIAAGPCDGADAQPPIGVECSCRRILHSPLRRPYRADRRGLR